MREIHIDDPIYNADISVLVGGKETDIQKLIDKRHGPGAPILNKRNASENNFIDGSCEGMQFHVEQGDPVFYVWLQAPSARVLWHEIFHLTFDVLESAGITYGDNCEEAFAYWGEIVFAAAAKRLKI